MIDGYSYKATPHASDFIDEATDETKIHIAAADGNEYKNSFDHADMADEFAILHMPGAAAALFQRRPDKISAEETDRLRVEWTITCPLTGPHTIAIHALISKRADPIDRLRIECEKRDMERKKEIAALRAEHAAEITALRAMTVVLGAEITQFRAEHEELRVTTGKIVAMFEHDKTLDEILEYFNSDIYCAFIHGGGAPPEFITDNKHWLRKELEAGYSLEMPHYTNLRRFATQSAISHLPRHRSHPSAFEFMIARIGPIMSGGEERAAKFLGILLPYVDALHIEQTCEWIERININNCAAIAKILRSHLAARPAEAI